MNVKTAMVMLSISMCALTGIAYAADNMKSDMAPEMKSEMKGDMRGSMDGHKGGM